MAAVSGQIQVNNPGGYLREIFGSRGPENKYVCNSCNLVLRDPVQAFCGHRYCKMCLEAEIGGGEQIRCQQCLEEDPVGDQGEDLSIITPDQIFPDNAIKREMGRLRVKCPNTGCTWDGIFRQYEEHFQVCDFKCVKCPDCQRLVRETEFETHQDTECAYVCQQCNATVLTRLRTEHVERECPKAVVACGLCGKEGIVRESLAAHQQSSECGNIPVTCPVGCGVIERKEYQNHFRSLHHEVWVAQEMTTLHMKLQQVSQTVEAFSEQQRHISERNVQVDEKFAVLDHRINEIASRPTSSAVASGDTQSISDRISVSVNQAIETKLHSVMQRAEVQINTFEGVATAMHREFDKVLGQVGEIKNTIQQNQTKIREQERALALKDVALKEMEIRMESMESASYDGTLIWKIAGYNQKYEDAARGRNISFYSPPFYTSKRGYKMCARLYPNGDGMGKGSHLSLFFVVMKGDFDALLTWPFGQRVTFCLINQNGKEHVVDSFRPDPQSSSFKRPTSDMNIASGCPLFIRQEILQNSTTGFVKDDVMFLKIAVDVTNLKEPMSTFEDRVNSQS